MLTQKESQSGTQANVPGAGQYHMFTSRALLFTILATPALAQQAVEEPSPLRSNRRTPVVEVFERCRDAVVNISTTKVIERRMPLGGFWDDFFDIPRSQREMVNSVGSGFIVHPDGYIVTNAHVVARTADVRVTFADMTSAPADVIAVDGDHDLAVLKIAATRPMPHLHLAQPDDLLVGETVVAVGNPLGLQHTVTAGIISALNREIRVNAELAYKGLIQTDTSINPGNSGGPLLNVNAELIGINTAIRGDAQNIGFAIPVKHLWELLPGMLDIERRQRVVIGLDVDGREAKVTQVRSDSPAQKAGLLPGDHILAVNGRRLENGIDYYVRLLEQRPGEKVRLAVRRGDREISAEVPLLVIPPPDGAALAQTLLGLKIRDLPASIRKKIKRDTGWDLPDNIGVLIESADRGSQAEKLGLGDGEILIRGVGRIPVQNISDVGRILEQAKPGERLPVEVVWWDAQGVYSRPVTLKTRGD